MGKIGGVPGEIAFDTQSSVSLMREEVLPRGVRVKEERKSIWFGDHETQIHGSCITTVTVGDVQMELQFWLVPKLIVEAVVGFPDMLKLRVRVEGDELVVRDQLFMLMGNGMYEKIHIPIQEVGGQEEIPVSVVAKSEETEFQREVKKEIPGWTGGVTVKDELPEEEHVDLSRLLSKGIRTEEEKEEIRRELASKVKEQPHLRDLIESISYAFENSLQHPGCASVSHRIDTGDAAPYFENVRRMSKPKREFLNKLREDWLDRGIIEPCEASEWAANIHCVKDESKPGGFRPCGDYRGLNSRTKADRYPTDEMEKVYDFLCRADLVTKLDCSEGYLAIPMYEGHKSKTAIHLPLSDSQDGLFQMKVCLFGLRNAAATYDRWMNSITASHDDTVSMRDDIFIRSCRKNGESDSEMLFRHKQLVKEVVGHVYREGGRLKARKAQLAVPAEQGVEALGYMFQHHRMRKGIKMLKQYYLSLNHGVRKNCKCF